MEANRMSFKRVEEIDEEDILMNLRDNPETIRITNVGELRESDNEEGSGYFYVTCENPRNFQSFDIGYNVKINRDGSIYVGSNSKLFPLLSYVSGIDDSGIRCDFDDITDSLMNLCFKARTERKRFGNKKYFIIIPIDDEDGE